MNNNATSSLPSGNVPREPWRAKPYAFDVEQRIKDFFFSECHSYKTTPLFRILTIIHDRKIDYKTPKQEIVELTKQAVNTILDSKITTNQKAQLLKKIDSQLVENNIDPALLQLTESLSNLTQLALA